MSFESPHIVSLSDIIELDAQGRVKHVLVVETNLELDVNHPDHSEIAVNVLISEVQSRIAGHVFDSAVIRKASTHA